MDLWIHMEIGKFFFYYYYFSLMLELDAVCIQNIKKKNKKNNQIDYSSKRNRWRNRTDPKNLSHLSRFIVSSIFF
jgi:hypothetical protein